jgi:hypothetical protein
VVDVIMAEVERLREDLAITERARKAERSERQQHEAEVERLRAPLERLMEATKHSIDDDDVWLPALEQARQALEEVGAS